MSRRAARFTQADMARALKAAEQAAPGRWRVRVSQDGEIVVEPAGQGVASPPPPAATPIASRPKWTL